jgi:hypothetical protein
MGIALLFTFIDHLFQLLVEAFLHIIILSPVGEEHSEQYDTSYLLVLCTTSYPVTKKLTPLNCS